MKLSIKHKLLLILLLILVACIIYYFFFKKQNINFYSKEKACHVLKQSSYFNNMTHHDIKTRKLNSNNKSKILEKYCSKLLDFTNIEKKALTWIITKISKARNDDFMNSPWNIVKFKDIEFNFPHTHIDCIYLPQNIITSIVNHYNKNNSILDMHSVVNTLIHEKVHVYQRKSKSKFDRLYKNWNFSKVKNIKGLEKYKKLVRNNPDANYDTSEYVFSYKGVHLWFDALFDSDAQNISDTKYIGVYLKKTNNGFQATNQYKDVKEINEFNDFFGNISNNYYHPNEISAELYTLFYLETLGIPINHDSKAYRILKEKNLF